MCTSITAKVFKMKINKKEDSVTAKKELGRKCIFYFHALLEPYLGNSVKESITIWEDGYIRI